MIFQNVSQKETELKDQHLPIANNQRGSLPGIEMAKIHSAAANFSVLGIENSEAKITPVVNLNDISFSLLTTQAC